MVMMKRPKSSALILLFVSLCASSAAAEPAPRRFIDAASPGQGAFADYTYFFANGYYVRYDMRDEVDRVNSGPTPLSAWPLTGDFAKGVKGAFNGQVGFSGMTYFFKGSRYTGFDWNADRATTSGTLADWGLTGSFASSIDAVINGQGPFYGFGYFFKGTQWVKYSWVTDSVVQAARPLSDWHLPVEFSTGVDAALDGDDPFGYFFRNDRYVTYDWQTDEPFDNAAAPIQGNWTGLVEMLGAARACTEGRKWVASALNVLRQDLQRANANQPPLAGVPASALDTHFHLHTVADRRRYLPGIITTFERIDGLLADPRNVMLFRTPLEALAEVGQASVNYYAYARFGQSVMLTENYHRLGPKSQTAVLIHELVHYIDSRADLAHDIYEGSAAYATLSAANASFNPSSYASFAGHVQFGSDVRYGGLHPDD
jgi:hypothetical protein